MNRVLIADGQTGELLDYITFKNIISDNHKKSLEDNLETFNFTTFADKRFSQHLEKRNRIIIPDEDNNLVEFVPFEIVKYRDSEGHKIQVYSHAGYLEIKKANVIYPDIYEGTATQHLGRALNDTGWRTGMIESASTLSITFESHTNPFAYLKRIARDLDLELNFRIEQDGSKITGRYVDLLERVGAWRNRTVEFGKDLDGIRRVEKQDIYTALLGIGPEDENGNRLEVFVEDEDALQRWGRIDEHGELQHLVGTHEIQSTRSTMTEAEARQYTRTELDKRINTVVTYETTIIDLEHVPGMQNKKIRHGDTIRIKDTKFNPPLFLEARVFESDGSIKTKGKKNIKLGDFTEFSQEEVDNIWLSLRKEIRNKISQSELIEYTYSKIEIDDKDEYIFDEGKTFAEAVGVEAKEYAESEDEALRVDVEGYADSVASQAEDNAKSYADDKSAEALSEALAQSVAQDAYDTKMAQIADDLSDKAGIAYVEGQLQVIDGALDDLNAEIDTKADSSTVYTIEDVDNMINNTVSVTQYTTDINGIVSDLSDQSTQIGQNTEAIGLKADQTDLNALTGTVDSHSAQFLTMADEISARVTADYVQTEIGNLPKWSKVLPRASQSEPIELTHLDGTSLNPSRAYEIYLSAETGTSINNYAMYTYESGELNLIERRGSNADARLFLDGDKVMVETNWTNTTQSYPYTVTVDEYRGKNGRSIISSLSAELSVQAGLISAKADSSTVNALGTRVSTAETNINALEGEITSKVSLSEFNALDGTVSDLSSTVSQQATQISARVTDSEARSIFTQEAGSFTFQANQINFDGHVFGSDATFDGKVRSAIIDTNALTIGYESLSSWNESSASLSLKNIYRVSTNVFGEGDPFSLIVGNNQATISFPNAIRFPNGLISGGHPVNTIVSEGSNSSGEWVRYSSGVQICWITVMSATGSTRSSGAIYRSEQQTWNFPKPFSSTPAVSGSVRALGRWLSSGVTSNTSATLVQYSTISGDLFGMDAIAIGRWD